MTRWTVRVGSCVAGGWLAALALSAQGNDRPVGSVTPPPGQVAPAAPGGAPDGSAHTAVVRRYCVGCHNERLKTGGLALDALDIGDPAAHAAEWEKVVTRLRAGTMPPSGLPRPTRRAQTALIGFLESELDRAWAANPNPGRWRRSPAEPHAVQQLDPRSLRAGHRRRAQLPGDETADGSFDNFADVLSFSTAHLERYLSVARQVTRLALGLPPAASEPSSVRGSAARPAGRSAERGPAARIARRHRRALQLPGRGEYPIKVRLRRSIRTI